MKKKDGAMLGAAAALGLLAGVRVRRENDSFI